MNFVVALEPVPIFCYFVVKSTAFRGGALLYYTIIPAMVGASTLVRTSSMKEPVG